MCPDRHIEEVVPVARSRRYGLQLGNMWLVAAHAGHGVSVEANEARQPLGSRTCGLRHAARQVVVLLRRRPVVKAPGKLDEPRVKVRERRAVEPIRFEAPIEALASGSVQGARAGLHDALAPQPFSSSFWISFSEY